MYRAVVPGRPSYLFAGGDLQRVLEALRADAISEAGRLPLGAVSGANRHVTESELVDSAFVEAPVLLKDEVGLDHQDMPLDARDVPGRRVSDRSRPLLIDGTRFVFSVPFEGDPRCFGFTPARRVLASHPPGEIDSTESCLRYVEVIPSDQLGGEVEEQLKSRFERWLRRVEELTDLAAQDVRYHNDKLASGVRAAVERRLSKLEADHEAANRLGIPIRKRADADRIRVPVKRKRLRPIRPVPVGDAAASEPELMDADFEEVVKVIRHLANTAERLPATFSTLLETTRGEESIRDLILFYLNGTFEGSAGGELFNAASSSANARSGMGRRSSGRGWTNSFRTSRGATPRRQWFCSSQERMRQRRLPRRTRKWKTILAS
jgi:hypothetical protein